MLRLSLLITATERVTAPLRRVRTGIRSMVKDGIVDLRKLDAAMDRLATSGQKMVGLGKKLSVGLTLPLGAFGISAFNAASDAAEMESAFNQTFGRLSGSMRRWAEQTGNQIGRSTQEMMRGANAFGMFFNQAAPPQKAAQMSATFSKLAQDLGSFFNVDTEDAIQKLSAGLSGETEPLRAFGVFMNEATIKAKALKLGLGGVGRELTDEEKVMARYAIILDKTQKAQGDAARTADSSANQIKRSKAAYEELQVTVGTKLLPKLTPLITKLASAVESFNRLPGPIQNTVLGLAGVALVSGPLVTIFGGLQIASAALIPRIVAMTAGFFGMAVAEGTAATGAYAVGTALRIALPWLGAITIAVAAVYGIWKNWDTIAPRLMKVWTAIKAVFKAGVDAIWNVLPAWMRGILTGTAKFAVKLFGGGSEPQASARGGGAAAVPRGPRMGPALGTNGGANFHRTSAANIQQRLDIRIRTDRGVDARPTLMKSSDRRARMDYSRGPLGLA